MQKLTAFLLLFSFFYTAAQPLRPADIRPPESADSAGNNLTLPIYNGRVFYGYQPAIGHAFYLTQDWQDGSVFYEGRWFTGVSIRYDVLSDEVQVLHPSLIPIRLFTDRVEEFKVGPHNFVKLTPANDSSLKTGFYQQLVAGEITILALRRKQVEETIGDNAVIRTYISLDTYYAVKDGKFYPISKQKDLLELVKAHKSAITKQLRQRGLKYKHDKEATIIQAAELYNQSVK